MASKHKSRNTSLSLDKATGRWCAKIGKKLTQGGKQDGHKFRFSRDKRESERRKRLIQELWDSLIDQHGPEYLWTEESLIVAKSLAEGEIAVAFTADDLAPEDLVRCLPLKLRSQARYFAKEIARLKTEYPTVNIVPTDNDFELFEKGKSEFATRADRIMAKGRHLADIAEIQAIEPNVPTVSEALDSYEEYLKKEFLVEGDWEEGLDGKRISDNGKVYLKRVNFIREYNGKEGHLDWPITKLTLDGCQAMIDVWRRRPARKDNGEPRAVKSCREVIKRFTNRKGFLRWLHRSDDFDWRKPADFDELETSVAETNVEIARRATPLQVDTYTVQELAVLNSFANATERFLLLAGLNLGFKRMEVATLRVSEVHLREEHPHAQFIGFESSNVDSFVKRIRRKSIVYGEWWLWPLTVQAMEWALARRRSQTKILSGDGTGRDITMRGTSLLMLNDEGHSYTKQTKGENPNHQLTNTWTRLLDRVCREHPGFRRLPQECLRDTAANIIRQEFRQEDRNVSSSEVASVYICHGKPFKTDKLLEVYANKPFGEVFAACKWFEEELKPMFDATPKDPFPLKRQTGGGGRLTRVKQDRIRRLHRQGIRKAEISRRVGVAYSTVHRYIGKVNGSARRKPRPK